MKPYEVRTVFFPNPTMRYGDRRPTGTFIPEQLILPIWRHSEVRMIARQASKLTCQLSLRTVSLFASISSTRTSIPIGKQCQPSRLRKIKFRTTQSMTFKLPLQQHTRYCGTCKKLLCLSILTIRQFLGIPGLEVSEACCLPAVLIFPAMLPTQSSQQRAGFMAAYTAVLWTLRISIPPSLQSRSE